MTSVSYEKVPVPAEILRTTRGKRPPSDKYLVAMRHIEGPTNVRGLMWRLEAGDLPYPPPGSRAAVQAGLRTLVKRGLAKQRADGLYELTAKGAP